MENGLFLDQKLVHLCVGSVFKCENWIKKEKDNYEAGLRLHHHCHHQTCCL